MRKTVWITLFLLPVLALSRVQSVKSAPGAQATIAPSIFIQSPRDGQPLQGLEVIDGKIRGDNFLQGKISFSYAGSDDPTWFLIADIFPEVEESAQTSFTVEWDTTQITDGNYDLRVVAKYKDGAAIFDLIPNLRIRNYSPVETSTPGLADNDAPVEETVMPTTEPTPRDTPTPLPPNPVEVQSDDLYNTLRISGITVVVLFIVGGIYWQIRTRRHRN